VNVSTLKGANAFAQASKYALTPENTPDSASIIAVGDTLRAAIAALPAETQDQVTVSVLGAASPE
jgi:hypothetical protein